MKRALYEIEKNVDIYNFFETKKKIEFLRTFF